MRTQACPYNVHVSCKVVLLPIAILDVEPEGQQYNASLRHMYGVAGITFMSRSHQCNYRCGYVTEVLTGISTCECPKRNHCGVPKVATKCVGDLRSTSISRQHVQNGTAYLPVHSSFSDIHFAVTLAAWGNLFHWGNLLNRFSCNPKDIWHRNVVLVRTFFCVMAYLVGSFDVNAFWKHSKYIVFHWGHGKLIRKIQHIVKKVTKKCVSVSTMILCFPAYCAWLSLSVFCSCHSLCSLVEWADCDNMWYGGGGLFDESATFVFCIKDTLELWF